MPVYKESGTLVVSGGRVDVTGVIKPTGLDGLRVDGCTGGETTGGGDAVDRTAGVGGGDRVD